MGFPKSMIEQPCHSEEWSDRYCYLSEIPRAISKLQNDLGAPKSALIVLYLTVALGRALRKHSDLAALRRVSARNLRLTARLGFALGGPSARLRGITRGRTTLTWGSFPFDVSNAGSD
jgi:hypothetical protein